MSEEDTGGQKPPEGQKPATPESTPSPESKPEERKPEPRQFDEGYVKELRAEAARNRKEAQEAKAKITEFEDRDKSELEKAQKRVTELEESGSGKDKTLQQLKVENAVLRSAGKVGITDPNAAGKLLDWSKIDYEEDGSPKNVESLLEGLAKDYPGLLGGKAPSTDFDGGVREPAGKPKSPEEAHADFLMDVFGKPSGQT